MIFAPDSYSSRRDTLAFVVCLVLAVAARMSPPVIQDAVAAGITRTVLAPFLFVQRQAEVVRASRGRYLQQVGARDSTLVLALQMSGLEQENEELRRILGLSSRLRSRHVSAEVLHQALPTSGLMVLLSAGRDDGVRAAAPVVAAGGLVGVVQRASGTQSVALLWTHPDFRVSGMALDGSVFGIVAPRGSEGPGTPMLELRGVPYQQDVPPGTVIYTSGQGGGQGVYPRGIPIGTIVAVGEEEVGWSRTYVVRPAVHPASISHVVVLVGPAVDLRGAFSDTVIGS